MPINAEGTIVCVTGAAGFLGSWLTKLLLERGYTVRACVRDENDERKTSHLKKMMTSSSGSLTLHSADMTLAGAYDEVFKGCTTVFHPAEVFMSFAGGRDLKQAAQDFRSGNPSKKIADGGLHKAAVQVSQYIVDSINRSGTVTRLVYTSSIAAMVSGETKFWEDSTIISEDREPQGMAMETYNATKRTSELFFAFSAAASGGRWTVVIANPADIIGPILSPHQRYETWQGKIARLIEGDDPVQEPSNAGGARPLMLVDVRDCAHAQILLAQSPRVRSGLRFLLASGDKVFPEEFAGHLQRLHPEWQCSTRLQPAKDAKHLTRNNPLWMRVQIRTDRIQTAVGMRFQPFDDTLQETVDALLAGGIKPKLNPA